MYDYDMVFPPMKIFLLFRGESEEDEDAEPDRPNLRVPFKPSDLQLANPVRFPVREQNVKFKPRSKLLPSINWNYSICHIKTGFGIGPVRCFEKIPGFDMRSSVMSISSKLIFADYGAGRKANISRGGNGNGYEHETGARKRPKDS